MSATEKVKSDTYTVERCVIILAESQYKYAAADAAIRDHIVHY